MSLILDLSLWPRQLDALQTDATELLFGGATEGGKSHLARVALIVWCLGIDGLQCVLIRKRYQDILNNHVEGPTGFRSLLAPLLTAKHARITDSEIIFANGSRIAFQHCQDERQFDSAQGVEVHVLVIDEATQITERLIRFFRTWVRMPTEMRNKLPAQFRDKFPRIIYTANPIGVSVSFFRRHFVKARPHQSIELVEGFKRQYLLSRYTDNMSVDADAHIGRLAGIGDKALARALDEGDWDAPVGEFFPEYNEQRHVVKDFIPPSSWFRFRVFDWGTADPHYVGWLSVSDGEPFKDSQDNERWFPRGALVLYNEWYGADATDPSKGIRMRNEEMALGIVARSELGHINVATLTDSLPFQDRGGETIAQIFAKNGVVLTRGDTTRVSGWSQLRGRLIGIEYDSNSHVRLPMVYFCESCKFARDYIPALPRHPSDAKKEDAAEHGEATHACDAIRLACTAHTVIKGSIEPLQARIERQIKLSRPTIKRITGQSGARIF